MTTDIDNLEGRELDEAVCLALGWTHIGIWWQSPHGLQSAHPAAISRDLGAAMDLLLSIDTSENGLGYGWSVQECDGEFGVYSELAGEPLASGPKDQAATVICRSWLKLKGTR